MLNLNHHNKRSRQLYSAYTKRYCYKREKLYEEF